jgi:putative endonuclease
MPDPTTWYLYIIRCRDGTYYTGITNNLDQRIHDHNHGKGCRYTKYRWPVRLMYSEPHADKVSAINREAQIQGWSRRKKEMLISSQVK